MYKRFQELLDIRGVTAYRVSKETGISPTVFFGVENRSNSKASQPLGMLFNITICPLLI
jgi:hypothetical protein